MLRCKNEKTRFDSQCAERLCSFFAPSVFLSIARTSKSLCAREQHISGLQGINSSSGPYRIPHCSTTIVWPFLRVCCRGVGGWAASLGTTYQRTCGDGRRFHARLHSCNACKLNEKLLLKGTNNQPDASFLSKGESRLWYASVVSESVFHVCVI